ncbi:uncharacterized protein LOC142549316 isoform X5 [Primulina tabacum]|uniref:uncharacterized protein LOC142549316 isoform X5 n=1 Tax=Primulina tabacum TaxID=48773 RepID=UPI003F59C70D
MSRSLKILRKQLEELVCLYGSWLSCSHCLYRSRKLPICSPEYNTSAGDWNSICSDHALQDTTVVLCTYHGTQYTGPFYHCSNMGVRKLEILIAFLVFMIAACFFVELGYAKPKALEVLNGLLFPQLKGKWSH